VWFTRYTTSCAMEIGHSSLQANGHKASSLQRIVKIFDKGRQIEACNGRPGQVILCDDALKGRVHSSPVATDAPLQLACHLTYRPRDRVDEM